MRVISRNKISIISTSIFGRNPASKTAIAANEPDP